VNISETVADTAKVTIND